MYESVAVSPRAAHRLALAPIAIHPGCSYHLPMNVATANSAGVREVKNNLSRYLERVKQGEEILITDRGAPVARLVGAGSAASSLQRLIDAGLVTPPAHPKTSTPAPVTPSAAGETLSEIVISNRR